MNDDITKLKDELSQFLVNLNFEEKLEALKYLNEEIKKDDFWANPQSAQKVSQKQAKLEKFLDPLAKLKAQVADFEEILSLNDASLMQESEKELESIKLNFEAIKKDYRFLDPLDDHNAILSVYAGAGGVDAQDWAEMLLRMYAGWAQKNDAKLSLIEESRGDEAGIKSATVEISGSYIYGKLKQEHGVHRLVRISPFNSGGTRETSFAKVDVLPEVESEGELELDEKDLRIDVFRAGGHGGQSVNTTDSAVRITHLPSGITVSIQNERSQLQNKATAMKILKSRLTKLKEEQHQEDLAKLKGPNQSAEWGNQIRNYVLHPYTLVKDQRTGKETGDVKRFLEGEIELVGH
ncbi:MAG: peptide chain release factor 2 [Candidatus Saccharimonadales bacterium]